MREIFTKCGKKIKGFFAKMTVEVNEKEDKEGWSLGDFVATVLRTMKLLWDVLLVFALGGLLFGAGIAIGYAASLFNATETRFLVSSSTRFEYVIGMTAEVSFCSSP